MGFLPSNSVEDADYLLSRAAAEAEAAERAGESASAEAHHRLASLYLDRLFGDGRRAPPERRRVEPRGPEKKVVAAPLRRLPPVADLSDFRDLLVRLP